MNRDIERHKEFTRRALLVGAAQAVLFCALGGRLAFLQVVQQEKFQTLSDKNRINIRPLPAARGEIMDRFGVPLAINTQNFRTSIIPEQSEDVGETLDKLGRLIPLSDIEKKEVLGMRGKLRPFTPLLVKENLTWEDMAKIEAALPELPGVSTDEGQSRSYPFGDATAHIIGYVGRVSEAEMTDDPVMTTPGFRIGKLGVEKKYDIDLRGVAGQVQSEVNAVGREIRELKRDEPKKGHRLTMTLDADLQMQCQDRLAKERSAAAVVMDADTGEVYALCSHPSYDPNVFSRGIPADLWEELLADDTHPLTNKAVAGQYPPGSTFKMVTALAILDAGISADARVFCPGYYMLGKDKFHCWKDGGHGSVDCVQAIAQSCDTYFYEMGRRIGIDAIADMAKKLGMGAKLDFDVPGEGAGLIPNRAWKQKRYNQPWHQGETLNSAIGQGHVLATPLQLATMTARLVNGGRAVKPILVRTIEGVGNQIPDWPDAGLRARHLEIIHRGMDAVVNDPRGTAFGARITEDPYSMGGKSGTAQVKRITMAQRAAGIKNESLPWKYRHHALFVAYAPKDKPKYVAAVIVEHGGGGSGVAAPIARDLLLAAQKRDPRQIRTVDEAVEKAAAQQSPAAPPENVPEKQERKAKKP